MWIGLVAFEKAFDTVEHASLWGVFASESVGPEYINVLKKLHEN